jgi:hypothetical protein
MLTSHSSRTNNSWLFAPSSLILANYYLPLNGALALNMRNSIILIILLTWTINVVANTFTYDIQKAGYDFEQYDLKGEATYPLFVKEFRAYPWKDQVGLSNEGTEPTISVKNKTVGTDLFVSVVGNPDEFAYLIGIVKPKKIKSFFGLGKMKEVRWVTIYVTEKSSDVEDTFNLFFNMQLNKLDANLKESPIFLEQEAAN